MRLQIWVCVCVCVCVLCRFAHHFALLKQGFANSVVGLELAERGFGWWNFSGVAPAQKRVWEVQKTLRRPLHLGSKRPFAPSANHFWRLSLFRQFSRSAASPASPPQELARSTLLGHTLVHNFAVYVGSPKDPPVLKIPRRVSSGLNSLRQ